MFEEFPSPPPEAYAVNQYEQSKDVMKSWNRWQPVIGNF